MKKTKVPLEMRQGVELVEAVIAKVDKEGFAVLGRCGVGKIAAPRPIAKNVLDRLAFPDGSPLSPSLRRWLAFDGAWLGWFDDLAKPAFKPKKLGAYARDEYDEECGFSGLEDTIAGDCFGLHFGADSRRFLYVGKPDHTGEYPVLLTDTDDGSYLCVAYPGIDVYLALHAGLIESVKTYTQLADDARYRKRMAEHAKKNLDGEREIDLEGDGTAFEKTFEPRAWKDGEPIPEGYRIAVNPFTSEKLLIKKR